MPAEIAVAPEVIPVDCGVFAEFAEPIPNSP
jgi:hypothetical protein